MSIDLFNSFMLEQEGKDINESAKEIRRVIHSVKIEECYNSHYVKVEINEYKRARLYYNKKDVVTRVRFY